MAAAGSGEAPPSGKPRRLCTFLKYIALGVVVGAVVGVVLALVHRPHSKKVDISVVVESASLTRFALTSSNALDYALALNLTWTNNDRLGVYFYELQARAFYGGKAFGSAALPKFSQPQQNSTTVGAKFWGQTQMSGGWVAEKLSREMGEGYYHIEVEVDVRLWTEKYHADRKLVKEAVAYSAEVDCNLKVPLAPSSNGSTANGFQRTRCEVKF
uniref:Putative syntaxin-24 n=1 Tax=Anthurium amnicola TaxID=1678845 RepID=A0A1D1Z4U2_9ARAE